MEVKEVVRQAKEHVRTLFADDDYKKMVTGARSQ